MLKSPPDSEQEEFWIKRLPVVIRFFKE